MPFTTHPDHPHTQSLICIIHLRHDGVDDSWFCVLMAVQHIFLWSKMHYFARWVKGCTALRRAAGKVDPQWVVGANKQPRPRLVIENPPSHPRTRS